MQKGINFNKLLKGYKSGWVAVSENYSKVIASGKTLQEVRKKTADSKEKVFYFPAGESYSNFIG